MNIEKIHKLASRCSSIDEQDIFYALQAHANKGADELLKLLQKRLRFTQLVKIYGFAISQVV